MIVIDKHTVIVGWCISLTWIIVLSLFLQPRIKNWVNVCVCVLCVCVCDLEWSQQHPPMVTRRTTSRTPTTTDATTMVRVRVSRPSDSCSDGGTGNTWNGRKMAVVCVCV